MLLTFYFKLILILIDEHFYVVFHPLLYLVFRLLPTVMYNGNFVIKCFCLYLDSFSFFWIIYFLFQYLHSNFLLTLTFLEYSLS